VNRAQKEKTVAQLSKIFETAGLVVVSHYEGLSVAMMESLRSRAREGGSAVRVAKNRLAKIALQGKACADLQHHLSGMTVLTYSEDPVAAAKVVEDFSKECEPFQILGGAMGETALAPAGVAALAKMPSREDLLGAIVSAVTAPASAVAGALVAPASCIASALSTIEERAGAAQTP